MKKKLLITVLVIIVALCCAFGFAACDFLDSLFSESSTETKTEQEGNTEKGNGTEGDDNLGHSHSYTFEVIEPTCTEEGYTLYTCEWGGIYKDNFVDALGHTEVIDEGIEATCTTDGLTVGKHCSVCKAVLVEQRVIPSLGHDIVNEECTRCDLEFTKGLTYTLNEDGESYSVSGIGTATDSVINITPVYNGKPVTAIGFGAFYGCETITSVIIPDSVTHIANEVLTACSNLTSVTIPDSVTYIDGASFSSCAFTSITIPDSVMYIGSGAFDNCAELTSLDLGNGVKRIEDSAFSHCIKLTSVVIPDSVTYLGSVFKLCIELSSITLPDSVAYIGSYAFLDTAYYSDEDNWQDGVLYIGNHIIAVDSVPSSYEVMEGTITLAGYSFNYQRELTNIIIPVSVVSIGDNAFRQCTNLTSIIYKGTMEQWQNIVKGSSWQIYTGIFIVHCTDGDLDKDGNVIEN